VVPLTVDAAGGGFVAWLGHSRRPTGRCSRLGVRTGAVRRPLPGVGIPGGPLPDGRSLAADRGAYAVGRNGPGRVLLAVDKSGSEGDGHRRRHPPMTSRLRAAGQALRTAGGTGRNVRPVVFPGHGRPGELPADISAGPSRAPPRGVEQRLRSVRVAGGTPVYTTIEGRGARRFGMGGASANALVVRTDGPVTPAGGVNASANCWTASPVCRSGVVRGASARGHCTPRGPGALTDAVGGIVRGRRSSSLDAACRRPRSVWQGPVGPEGGRVHAYPDVGEPNPRRLALAAGRARGFAAG